MRAIIYTMTGLIYLANTDTESETIAYLIGIGFCVLGYVYYAVKMKRVDSGQPGVRAKDLKPEEEPRDWDKEREKYY